LRAATVENRGAAFVIFVVIRIRVRLNDHYLRVWDCVSRAKEWRKPAMGTMPAKDDRSLETILKEWAEAAVAKAAVTTEAIGPERGYAGRDARRK
jgi:hypothetical protein